jgi:DNA-binding IclR family transcriptional regulator
MSARIRILEALDRRSRPATASLLAHEADCQPSTAAQILRELVELGAATRTKPAGAYRYELVRP